MKKVKFTFPYHVRPGARKLPKEEKKLVWMTIKQRLAELKSTIEEILL